MLLGSIVKMSFLREQFWKYLFEGVIMINVDLDGC